MNSDIEETDFILNKQHILYNISRLYNDFLKDVPNVPDVQILQLKPNYQRNLCWDYTNYYEYLQSIWNGFAITPIVLCKLNNFDYRREVYDKYECIDGQHRLTTIKHYITSTPLETGDYIYIRIGKRAVFYENNEKCKEYIKHNSKYKTKNCYQLQYDYLQDCDKARFDRDIYLSIFIIHNSDLTDKRKKNIFFNIQQGKRVDETEIFKNNENSICNVIRDQFNKKEYIDKVYQYIEFDDKSNRIQYIDQQKIFKLYLYFCIRMIYILSKSNIKECSFETLFDNKKLKSYIENNHSIDVRQNIVEIINNIFSNELLNKYPHKIYYKTFIFYIYYLCTKNNFYHIFEISKSQLDICKLFNFKATTQTEYIHMYDNLCNEIVLKECVLPTIVNITTTTISCSNENSISEHSNTSDNSMTQYQVYEYDINSLNKLRKDELIEIISKKKYKIRGLNRMNKADLINILIK